MDKNSYKDQKNWEVRLDDVLRRFNAERAKGQGNVSLATQRSRDEILKRMFRTLRNDLHFLIDDPTNLKLKHVDKLVEHWLRNGDRPNTLDTKLSNLRTYAKWIGKGGLVKPLSAYAPDLRREVVIQRKEQQGELKSFWPLWDEVHGEDPYVAMQWLFIQTFNTRLDEALTFKPLVADHSAESFIEVTNTTGDRRPRTILLNNPMRQSVLVVLQQFVTKKFGNAKAHLGRDTKTVAQNRRRFYYILEKCGVTREEIGGTGRWFSIANDVHALQARGLI